MAAGSSKKTKFPPALFDTAPIVFSSTHGVYWPEATPKPFKVPKNTYIFETQYIGDLCLTTIDEPLWTLMQGDNRDVLKYYLAGKFTPADLEEDEKPLADTIRYLNYYEPGDLIYNRYLSIGGGRGPSGSARIVYANMGFYLFPVGAPTDVYPNGPKSKILNRLRDDMIMDDSVQVTYQEFINTTYKARPELLESGCIFVFSCCAEARKQDITEEEFNAKINEIEARQQEQHQKLLALTPAAMGGPLDSVSASGAMGGAAAPAAIAASGAGGGAAAALPKGAVMAPRRAGLRGALPREFHPSAFGRNKLEYRQLADTGWADREVRPHPQAPAQPEGTYVLFRQMKKGTLKQVIEPASGKLFFSPTNIRAYRRENPSHVLKIFMPDGSFADVTTIPGIAGGGGRRRRHTRKHRVKRRSTYRRRTMIRR
jgi:hypothetical protein